MSARKSTIRYVPDGMFNVGDLRARLSGHGALVSADEGRVKFVPDDPGYPTTVFDPDGIIEMDVPGPEAVRLEEYAEALGEWLGTDLQRAEPSRE